MRLACEHVCVGLSIELTGMGSPVRCEQHCSVDVRVRVEKGNRAQACIPSSLLLECRSNVSACLWGFSTVMDCSLELRATVILSPHLPRPQAALGVVMLHHSHRTKAKSICNSPAFRTPLLTKESPSPERVCDNKNITRGFAEAKSRELS